MAAGLKVRDRIPCYLSSSSCFIAYNFANLNTHCQATECGSFMTVV